MSFKDFIKESDDSVISLINSVNSTFEKIDNMLNSLQLLKDLAADGNITRKLGNINLSSQVDKIEMKMKEVVDLLQRLQNSVTGGLVVSNRYGEWGGPD